MPHSVNPVLVGGHILTIKTVKPKTDGPHGDNLIRQKRTVRLFGKIELDPLCTLIDDGIIGQGIAEQAQKGRVCGIPYLKAVKEWIGGPFRYATPDFKM